MRSTVDNLTNPLYVDLLNVPYDHPIWKTICTTRVTQFFYDHIQIKDPNTLYIITDAKDRRAYLGAELINNFQDHVSYMLGPSNNHGEYVLYMNCTTDFGQHLFPICRFNDPQKAIDALNLYNRTGSHHAILIDVRTSIISFIENDIGVHDFVIGIISMFGYRDDPRLQDVMAAMRSYGAADNKADIGKYARMMAHQLSKTHKNPCYKFYSDVYDILVSYNFFRTEKYTKDPENAELSVPVHKISDAMTSTLLPRI